MSMIVRIRAEVVEKIFWVQLTREEDLEEEVERLEEEHQKKRKVLYNLGEAEAAHKQPARSDKVAGRNDPCPCGSGKKFKRCCGK